MLAVIADLPGTRARAPRPSAIVVALMEGRGDAPAGGPDTAKGTAISGASPEQGTSALTPSSASAAPGAASLSPVRHHAARESAPAIRAPRHAAPIPDGGAAAALTIRDAAAHAETLASTAPDPAAPAASGGVGADVADDASAGGAPATGAGAHGTGDGGAGGAGGGDLRAWCRSCPRPEYPARARREGWQGTVDVELHVDRDGVVEHASVERSSGFAVLDAAAVTVARQSRFAVPRGESLRGQLRYRFVLEDGLSRRPL
jgi:protein TonB